jgi:uncharacterized metal-binding protein YceD (DUF177 family)
MPAGLPDLVDCARLAEDGAKIERVYALRELPRVQDILAQSEGSVRASFAFAKVGSEPGASVSVEAAPRLICQRCMQAFAFPVAGSSEVEFAADAERPGGPQREVYQTRDGWVSLRDLAEEELLLALPIAPACSVPDSCGNAVAYADGATQDAMRRPFFGLKSLLKNTQS